MKIFDYIKKHKDEDFNTFSFTEVDYLIFSLMLYIDLTGIIPSKKRDKITLKEAFKKLEKQKENYRGFLTSNTYKMIKLMQDTKRYENILLSNYLNIVNDDMQFGALTIKYNKTKYIIFAGTDSSIIGWMEDFKMAYLYPGVSQKYASIYLNKAINFFDRNVYIIGHSKGGNLGISAAMMVNIFIKSKIKAIYNFDGPGFLKEQINSKHYQTIKHKIKMYVPKECIIGMILYHTEDYFVVKAKGFSILEHNGFNWLCNNETFLAATQSKRSKNIEAKLTKKLEKLPITSRINLVERIFLIFKDNNINDTKDIKINKIFNLIKGFTMLDKETQNLFIELIFILFIK